MRKQPRLHPAVKGYPKRWHIETLPDGKQVKVIEEFTITGISLEPHNLVMDVSPEGMVMLEECFRPVREEDLMREAFEETAW